MLSFFKCFKKTEEPEWEPLQEAFKESTIKEIADLKQKIAGASDQDSKVTPDELEAYRKRLIFLEKEMDILKGYKFEIYNPKAAKPKS